MVSVPDEATAYAMKAIKNLKFNYVHMLILLGYGARSRRSPAPTGQREMGYRGLPITLKTQLSVLPDQQECTTSTRVTGPY